MVFLYRLAPVALAAFAVACSTATADDSSSSSSEANLSDPSDDGPPAKGPLTPDPTFATGGSLDLAGPSHAVAAARRADGALAIVRDRAADVVLTIVAADGSSSSDVALPDAKSLQSAHALPQGDGVIVVGQIPVANKPAHYFAARIGANGALDRTFMPDPLDFTAVDTAIDKSGRILIAGVFHQHAAIVRLTANGTLDGTFAAQGAWIASDDHNAASKLALADDGTISAVTQSAAATSIMRFDANGKVDSKFGNVALAIAPSTAVGALIATANGGLTYVGSSSFSIDAHGAVTPADAVAGDVVDASSTAIVSAVTNGDACTLHVGADATTELTAAQCKQGVDYVALGNGRRAIVLTTDTGVTVRVFGR